MKGIELKKFREEVLDFTQVDFSVILGISISSIQKWEASEELNSGAVKKLKNKYIQVNSGLDVVSGKLNLYDLIESHIKGDIDISIFNFNTYNSTGAVNIGEPPARLEENITKHEKKGVPFYDIEFTAGFDIFFNNQVTEPSYLVTDPYFKDCDFIARATGKSMEKFIKHGEAVGFKRVPNWQEFFTLGEIYGIVTTNGLQTIKIINRSEKEGFYKLIPKPYAEYASDYSEQDIPKKMITHLFKVQASKFLF